MLIGLVEVAHQNRLLKNLTITPAVMDVLMINTDPIALVCLLLLVLLVAISVSGWFKRHWQLSLAACFVLIGFIVLNGMALFTSLPTIHHDQLQQLTRYILLPVLLTDAVYHFNIHGLRQQRWRPFLLLLPLFLVTLSFSFLFLLWGLNTQSENQLLMVLAAALLLVVIDLSPSHKKRAQINTLDNVKQDKIRYTALVEVESLGIGVLALILFLAVSGLTGTHTETAFMSQSVTWFWLYWLWTILGGVVFGFIWGVIGGLITTGIQNHRINLLLLAVISWLSYLTCQHYFGVSGIMALLTSTLIMNKAHGQFLTPREIRYIRALFRNIRFIAGIVIYGLIIYALRVDLIINYWLSMLLAVVTFILARAISLYGFLPLMAQLIGTRISHTARHILFISTSHSSLILLAVWLLPTDIPARNQLEAMAMALVLFSLFVHGPNLSGLFQRLNPKKPPRRINFIK